MQEARVLYASRRFSCPLLKNDTPLQAHFPMCINIKKIYNKYTDSTFYANCGKCYSCQMEKAKYRASMVRYATCNDDLQSIFFHLTYSDDFVPYFRIDDLNRSKFENHISQILKIPIYRNCKVYDYYNRRTGQLSQKRVFGRYKVAELALNDYNPKIDSFHSLSDKSSSRDFNDVGCILFKDVQDFFKRLRINIDRYLKRHDYLSKDEFSFVYAVASEYGAKFERPHFHVLITCKKAVKNFKLWQRLILKSWKFAFRYITKRYIEIARDPSNYISLYINKLADISPFLQKGQIKPRFSHSQNYCIDCKYFQPDSLFQKIQSRNLFFNREVFQNHVSLGVITFPIPRYILLYYFPKFRGFSYLSDNEVFSILQDYKSFDVFASYAEKMKLFFKNSRRIDWDLVERCYNYMYKKISFFIEKFHLDFVHLYMMLQSALRNRLFRFHFDDSIQNIHRYYNLSDLCVKYNTITELETDYNKYPQNVEKELSLTREFVDRSRYIHDNQCFHSLFINRFY